MNLDPAALESIVSGKDQSQSEATATAIDADGFVFNVETGEVVGHAYADNYYGSIGFSIDSDDAANWTLELRSKIAGNIAGIKARREAVNKQLDKLLCVQEQRMKWWTYRFSLQLSEFARKKLAGGKKRTADWEWGSVAFRKIKGTNKIVNMEAAVEWMEEHDPVKVRVVKSVTVTDVMSVAEKYYETEIVPLRFVESSGAGEKVTISTGLEDA